MEKQMKKFSLAFLALLVLFAGIVYTSKILAATVARSDYQVSTVFKNNGADVINNGRYGDSKFIITPTFKIADSRTLANGDIIEYPLPAELQFDMNITRELKSTDATGEVHFATLRTDQATKIATIEIVDASFFARLGNNKIISADITAVWDRNVMPLNQARTFNLEGYGDITLTRILIDEEPRGISKWGVQRSDDPSIIEWRIRVNRDLNTMTNVSIEDTIRPGQELVGTVRGHYFHDFYNPSPLKPNVSLNSSNSTITVMDSRHFSIQFQDLTAKGAFIYYQTKLVDPSTVEASTTNIYNDVTLRKDGSDPVVTFTGHAKISRIGGSGSADPAAVSTDIVVSKDLLGRTQPLQDDEFEFELVNDKNAVVTTAKNKADGTVTFSQIRFTAQGSYQYKIREKKAGQTESGITYSTEEIAVTVNVTANAQNQLVASVVYPTDTKLTNTYQATATSAAISVKTTLTGKEIEANQFEFELVDDQGQVLATAKNALDGSVTFPSQAFNTTQTTSYQVRQKNGGQIINGIAHDGMTATITVDVTDNNKGQLQASVTYPADISFDNFYRVSPTSIDIEAAKVLRGREAVALANGEFNFTLTSEDGSQVYQASNKADGTVTFKDISFAEAKTYRFTLSETAGTDGRIKYDNQTYPVEVAVTDNKNGTLTATVTSATITFTNYYTPEKITIPVRVEWEDANNQDGKRTSVLVKLYADGVDTGKTVTLTADNNWEASFVDVDADKAGATITYSVESGDVDGYTAKGTTGDSKTGFVIHYQRVPATIDFSVTKTWNDANDQDGKRPLSVNFTLYKEVNGQKTQVEQRSLTVAGSWTTQFTGLAKYEAGQEIIYSVEEEVPALYVAEVTKDTAGNFTITNTHPTETTTVPVTKVWDDANDQDGKRPSSITVHLQKSLEGQTPATVASATITEADNWTTTFSNLPAYEAGKKITYTVVEDKVSEYTTTISGDAANGFTITNLYLPAVTEISGTKTWNDADNQDGKRPNSITVNLLANGQVVDSRQVSEATGWAYDFGKLATYKNGQLISYTIAEEEVPGYSASQDGYNLTNTYTPEKATITVNKTWEDADNQDGKRPSQITIHLMKTVNATKSIVATKTITAADNWTATFAELPVYEAGQKIVYSVEEETVADYRTEIKDFTIINSYTPQTMDYQVTKVWDDANNQDGLRPESITVQLYKSVAGGAETPVTGKTLLLTAANQLDANTWSASFTGLPQFEQGQEIVYSVKEDEATLAVLAEKGYQSAVTGTVVTNSRTPEQIKISGKKVWDDANNQDGIRPEAITVQIMNGTLLVDEIQVTAANDWTFQSKDLPKYANGQEIAYTVVEVGPASYQASQQQEADGSYTLTNSYEPSKTSLLGTAIWSDVNNYDGIRPDSIVVRLLSNGRELKALTLSAETGWQYAFTDLPKYANGQEIVYSISSDPVAGYDLRIDGTQITNIHIPQVVPTEPPAPMEPPAPTGDLSSSVTVTPITGKQTILPRTGQTDGLWLTLSGIILALVTGFVLKPKKLN